MVNRQFVLASRPVGMPKESDLRMVETPVPALREGGTAGDKRHKNEGGHSHFGLLWIRSVFEMQRHS